MRLGKFMTLAIIMTGCQQREAGNLNIDHLFFDYRITANENSEIACVFQYKLGGPDGEAIAIMPAKVELDGKALTADSAGFSGIYYENYFPADGFLGKHTIDFTTPDGKIYREEFLFRPFGIEELPERVNRHPFVIRLRDFSPDSTMVRLMLIDTAFSNNDVIDLVYVVNSELNITDEMLSQLKSGPISMEVYREEERQVKNRTRVGGRIFLSYGLQRDFELVDD